MKTDRYFLKGTYDGTIPALQQIMDRISIPLFSEIKTINIMMLTLFTATLILLVGDVTTSSPLTTRHWCSSPIH